MYDRSMHRPPDKHVGWVCGDVRPLLKDLNVEKVYITGTYAGGYPWYEDPIDIVVDDKTFADKELLAKVVKIFGDVTGKEVNVTYMSEFRSREEFNPYIVVIGYQYE